MNSEKTPAKIIIFFAIGLALVAGGIVIGKVYNTTTVDSFESCIAAGYPTMDSNPVQCMANGQVFVENTSKE